MKAKVFAVDDNPDDLRFIQRAAARAQLPLDVETFEDGDEVLPRLLPPGQAGDRPALVLVDLKMQRMDGFECLQRLRADNRTRALPVVVFTSSSEPADVERCRRLGASAYVRKPDDILEFRRVAVEILTHWALNPGGPASGQPWDPKLDLLSV